MSLIDRARASRLLAEAGLDALVVAAPEPFFTITGVSQGVAALFRRAGAGFAVLPADPALPVGAVVGDLGLAAARAVVPDARSHPLWIEQAVWAGADGPVTDGIVAGWREAGRPAGFARPATFDLGLALDAVKAVLGDRGLADGRLGFDFDFIAANEADRIRAAWSEGRVRDGSDVLARLRMVKTPAEIARLTLALEWSEAGLRRLAADIRPGQGADDLHELFRACIAAEAARRGVPAPPSWDYIGIGPEPWRAGGRVTDGAIVKADVGCVIDGYSSDTSRNFVFGRPSRAQADLHRILEDAFAAGLATIRPGVPMRAAHRATTAVLEAAGLTGFSRGHFGHGLGNSLISEQWPFIAADAETPFEPGMVMAFEVPLYVDGLGGFNLEDQFIVAADGPRVMTTLPRRLIELGG